MNIPAESGDMGILSNHVPSIEPLRPGVVEIIESNGTQKFFGISHIVLPVWFRLTWFFSLQWLRNRSPEQQIDHQRR